MFIGIKKNIDVRRKRILWSLDLSEVIDLSIFLFGSFQRSLTQSIISLVIKISYMNNKKINIIDVGSNIGDKF